MSENIVKSLKLPSSSSSSNEIKLRTTFREYGGDIKMSSSSMTNMSNLANYKTGKRVESLESVQSTDGYDWFDEIVSDSQTVNSFALTIEGIVLRDKSFNIVPVIVEPVGSNIGDEYSSYKVSTTFNIYPIPGQSYSRYTSTEYTAHVTYRLWYVTQETE